MNPEGVLKHSEISERNYKKIWQEWENLWKKGKPTNKEIEIFCKKKKVEFIPPIYKREIEDRRERIIQKQAPTARNLAGITVEAIKTIARNVEEKKCPECKGTGKVWWANYLNQSDCTSCNGTGKVAGKKWEWKPKPKDICFDKAGHELVVVGINSRKPWTIEVARVYEDGINMDSEAICPDEVIPLLDWQEIERILEKMGWSKFEFSLWSSSGKIEASSYRTGRMGDGKILVCSATGKDRQTSVMLAITKLRKRIENG